MLKLEVWNYDWPDSDDIIGSFTFDLDDVRRRPNKEYYKAWVTLFNTSPGSAKEDGPQGDVLLSVTVLEPGDELPPRPGRPCSEEAGEVKSFDLSLSCYCAEALPQMDKSGLADPYISVSWSGKKARTAEAKGTLKPDFDQELTLPVDIEQHEDAPPTSDLVVVRVREYNMGSYNQDVAYGSIYLSDVQRGNHRN